MGIRLKRRSGSVNINQATGCMPPGPIVMVACGLLLAAAVFFQSAPLRAAELAFQEVEVPTALNRSVLLRFALEPDAGKWRPIVVGRKFENDLYELSIREKSLDKEAAALDMVLHRKNGEAFKLLRFESTVKVDAARVQKVWPLSRMCVMHGNSNTDFDRCGGTANSHASSHDPVIMALQSDGTNVCTVGLAWTAPETQMTWKPIGSDVGWLVQCGLSFARPALDGVPIVTREYHDGIFVSQKAESWYDSVRRYAAYVDQERGYKPRPPAKWALSPCWTPPRPINLQAKYKDSQQKIIESQFPLAKELGFGIIHVDIDWTSWDGCYEPNKGLFPDFAGMMKKLRDAGMILEAHVSTPTITPGAPNYDRFKQFNMITNDQPNGVAGWGGQGRVLCPRTKGMQEHLVTSMQHMVRDLGIKSFWIDFNDDFVPVKPCLAKHDHAWSTLGEGWDAQMKGMTQAAWEIDPEVTFIARRSIANINNKPYLTHMCSIDCEYDQSMQRREAIFIRSFGPGVIPYTFHGVWAESELDAEVARHMASYAFLMVPVVCQDLSRLPPGHIEVVRAWLKFYREHAADIIYGDLEPLVFMPPSAAFRIERSRKAFVGCFETVPGTIPLTGKPSEIYLFNGVAKDFSTRITGVEGKFRGEWLDYRLRPYGAPVQVTAENGKMYVSADCPVLPCMLRLKQE